MEINNDSSGKAHKISKTKNQMQNARDQKNDSYQEQAKDHSMMTLSAHCQEAED